VPAGRVTGRANSSWPGSRKGASSMKSILDAARRIQGAMKGPSTEIDLLALQLARLAVP
jgi:hypothetical protein